MNMITKSVLTLLAASSIATVAVAAPGDATYGQITLQKANIQSLSAKIDSLGGSTGSDVSLNTANTQLDKAHALETKASNLQLQLNALQDQKS